MSVARKGVRATLLSLSVFALLALVLAAGASAAPVYTLTVHSGNGGAEGTEDPNVEASFDGKTWKQAVNVEPQFNYSVIPGTNWDDIAVGEGEVGTFFYRTAVKIPRNATNASLSGEFYSDNQGTAFVNGTQVAQNVPCGPEEGQQYGEEGFPATSFTHSLTSGANTLSFTVENCGGPTGVDFTATASYSLELPSKEQCKKGGWRELADPRDGKPFRNQGDCVSAVVTGDRNG